MRQITRREFVRVSTLVTAATVATACSGATATPEPTATTAATVAPTATTAPEATSAPEPTAVVEPTATTAAAFSEAPMLVELVASGDLPPVEERLPENPCVCPVNESTGKYGGVIRRAFKGVSDGNGPTKLSNEGLLWFNLDLSIRANLAESWEVNEDGSEWTIYLRKGTRWSDGKPLTSAAASWYWEHVLGNEVLTPVAVERWGWGSPRQAAELTTPDDFTITLKYGEPKPLLLYELTRNLPFVPGHYYEQFHPDFVDEDALTATATEAGFSTWDLYYADRTNWLLNPKVPVMYVWKMDNSMQDELFTMSRNPYFWQVDEDGQQLPYIDTVNHRLFESADVFNMWIVNGEIDYQGRHTEVGNYTLFKESEESGEFTTGQLLSAGHPILTVNMTCKNEQLREFFMERDARIAMSYAMDRDSINELAFNGLGTPRQFSPIEGSPNYYADLSNCYLDYDPDKANDLLDGLGYTDKNEEGYRLYKDGSGPVSFTIEMFYETGDPNEDAAQMVIQYLAAVGINAQYKYVERSLFYEHCQANDVEANNWQMDRTVLPLAATGNFTADAYGTSVYRPWAGAWTMWYADPTDPNAEEPPEGHWIWDVWDLSEQIKVEADTDKQKSLFQQILDIWIEELPAIGLLGQLPQLVIVKNGLMNFIDGVPCDDPVEDEELQNPQQFYWDNPEEHGA